jgi:hypothetical protein
MSSKTLLRKVTVTLAAGMCAALIGTITPARAQLQMLGASALQHDSAPKVAPAQRLLLHGVRLRSDGVAADKNSAAVLDYAAKTLMRYPQTTVYVSGDRNGATAMRLAQAAATSLKERGIAANRLVLSKPADLSPAAADNPAQTHATRPDRVIVLNLTPQPCATCS